METVEMLVTPGKQELLKRMQVREGHITPDKHLAPDEQTDASEDDAELVDVEPPPLELPRDLTCQSGCR
jgi:hypothetical protein